MKKTTQLLRILFLTMINSTMIFSRYIIFDINGLVESKESWIASTKKLSGKYKLLRVDTDFSNASLGQLFTMFGVAENERDKFMKELWANFALEQHQKSSSGEFEAIKPVLEQLHEDYELGILTSNPKYVQEVLKRGGIDHLFTKIWDAGANNNIMIDDGILTVKAHKDFIVNLAATLEEAPIFVVQIVDFAYALAQNNILCIGGAWGFHSTEAFASYTPNVPVAQTPQELPHCIKTLTTT